MINGYENTLTDLIELLESSRRAAARSVNAIMTATYWQIGRRIVELEQGGEKRAEYGAAVLKRLSGDLTARFGKGFSRTNLQQMRTFYIEWQICQTVPGKSNLDTEISQTLSAESNLSTLAQGFPLPWSHYVRLLSVQDLKAREFYETEALRVEYFLLELGSEFAFVARQKRLRVGDEWYRVDLLFFHRVLRCLIVIDLKLGKLTPADTGQMNFYVNYAKEHWTYPGENPPVGLILCSEKDDAVAHYALENLPNILAREYQLKLPDEEKLAAQIEEARKSIEEKM